MKLTKGQVIMLLHLCILYTFGFVIVPKPQKFELPKVEAQASTSPSASIGTITGTNFSGVIDFTVATHSLDGTLNTITFGPTKQVAPPGCVLQARPGSASSYMAQLATDSPSATTWHIVEQGSTSIPVGTELVLFYICT